MKNIKYLITAIILTFTLTLYVKDSSTTSLNDHVKLSHQEEQMITPFFTKLTRELYQKSLAGVESLFPCIVDKGSESVNKN